MLVLLFVGIIASVVGYVGCFSAVQGSRSSKEALIWLCLAYSLLVLFMPTLIFTRILIGFLSMMFFCIAYSMYVFLLAARHRRSGSVFALLSTGVMLFIGTIMNLHYFGFISDWRAVLLISYITFFFLQSLALSHRFAFNFRQATWLAQQGLRTKSEFLSTMSHEIRTPLNGSPVSNRFTIPSTVAVWFCEDR